MDDQTTDIGLTLHPGPFDDTEGVLDDRRAMLEGVADLAADPDPLGRAVRLVHRTGVVNEERLIRALLLIATSRGMSKPLHCMVRGASSSGKSYIVGQVLNLVPEPRRTKLVDWSETALFGRPDGALSNTVLFLAEASVLQREEKDGARQAQMRELMEDQHVRRWVRVQDAEGQWVTEEQDIQGPVSVIMTSTTELDEELTNRILVLPSDESQSQTVAILGTMAGLSAGDMDDVGLAADMAREQDFQELIASGPATTAIPFARDVFRHMRVTAVHHRRGGRQLLGLVQASAILHQFHRDVDDKGRLIATLEDYAIARDIMEPLLAEDAGASVPVAMRDFVEAVETEINAAVASAPTKSRLPSGEGVAVTNAALAQRLGLAAGTVSSRLIEATKAGFVTNLETRPRQAARLVMGPRRLMDTGAWILPPVDMLSEDFR